MSFWPSKIQPGTPRFFLAENAKPARTNREKGSRGEIENSHLAFLPNPTYQHHAIAPPPERRLRSPSLHRRCRHAPLRSRQGAPCGGHVPARRGVQISSAVASRSGAASSSRPGGGGGDGGRHGEGHVHGGRRRAASVTQHHQPQGAAFVPLL